MRRASGLIVVMLAVGLMLTACGGGNTPSPTAVGASGESTGSSTTASSTTATNEPPYVVKMAYIIAAVPKDQQLVLDKINEITLKKVNVKVDALPISAAAYNQQITLMLAGNEKLDLMFELQTFTQDIAKGALLALDDLLKTDGADILSAVGPDDMKAMKVNGKTYGVPTIRDGLWDMHEKGFA